MFGIYTRQILVTDDWFMHGADRSANLRDIAEVPSIRILLRYCDSSIQPRSTPGDVADSDIQGNAYDINSSLSLAYVVDETEGLKAIDLSGAAELTAATQLLLPTRIRSICEISKD